MRLIFARPAADRRFTWAALIVWLVLLVPAVMLGTKVGDVQRNGVSSWLPDRSESTSVLRQAKDFQAGDTLPAIVVYERASGVRPEDTGKALADAAAFQRLPDVAGKVQRPITSDDGKAIETVVAIRVTSSGWTGIAAVVDRIRAIASDHAQGLTEHVTGPGGYAADSGKIFGGAGSLMAITLVTVIVILLVTYRSPVLWLLPVIAAGAALMTAQAVVYVVARLGLVTVNAQTGFILGVLVFGVATDYALLLIARYREELRRYENRYTAMARALRTSGPTIVASAATVAVSLAVLFLATLNSTAGLGPVCAIGVLTALSAMVTLLPALLVTCGRWVFWPARPLPPPGGAGAAAGAGATEGAAAPTRPGGWEWLAARISSRPRLVWTATALGLGALTLGLTGISAHGIPQRDQYTVRTQAVDGDDVIVRHFPAGSGNPLAVITSARSADRVRLALSTTPGVASVFLLDTRDGRAFVLATTRDVPGTPAALQTAALARAVVHAIPGADARLGGGAAITLDLQNGASRDSWVLIPLILAVVLLILAVLLRSIVAPLVLVATVVLSYAAALGISVPLFHDVLHFGGMDAAFPLQAFTFLVALGIDYNIFLVARVREEVPVLGTRRATISGLGATGGVITSAGLVLAGTFAALASLPMVFAAELGFTVAVGVLLDTLIVRVVLVTALTQDLGRLMWWPSRLADRRAASPLPHDPARRALSSDPVDPREGSVRPLGTDPSAEGKEPTQDALTTTAISH